MERNWHWICWFCWNVRWFPLELLHMLDKPNMHKCIFQKSWTHASDVIHLSWWAVPLEWILQLKIKVIWCIFSWIPGTPKDSHTFPAMRRAPEASVRRNHKRDMKLVHVPNAVHHNLMRDGRRFTTLSFVPWVEW